ncbi:MAG: hypothetical protein IKY46_06995 [Clostridia bacterium]|nr:hypothetical protein [Clostridia bacterium]
MLKAGFARLDVTPPLGSDLAGYFSVRLAEGILDPIYLNAVAIGNENSTIVIITSDFLSIMEVFATRIRNMIAAATGIPADNIMITALHQHTSIRLGVWPWTGSMEDENYLNILYKKYVDVARLALRDMSDAKMCTAVQETAETISFIRRYKMKDGSTVTNPGKLNPNIDHPIGEADNNVRLVRFKRDGKKDIAFVNFSTHPDVIGGKLFSADWPGFVRSFVEQDIADTHCLVANGAQGDTNHVNTGIAEEQGGYGYSEHMGRVIADTVIDVWDKTVSHSDTQIFSEVRMVLNRTNTDGFERVEECRKLDEAYWSGKLDGPNKPDATIMGEARRIKNLPYETICQKIPVTVMAVGDVAFVGYGGEPFTEYATRSRAAAKEMTVITCGLANGQQGYLPTKNAFLEGGYEARSSRFTPTLPDELVGAASEMLDKCNIYKK